MDHAPHAQPVAPSPLQTPTSLQHALTTAAGRVSVPAVGPSEVQSVSGFVLEMRLSSVSSPSLLLGGTTGFHPRLS